MDTNNILSLNLCDNIIDEIFGKKEFLEFSYALNFLDEYGSPKTFLEKVEDEEFGMRKKMSRIAKNTKDTTRETIKVYGQLTDAGGGLVKTGWDLMMKCITLGTKTIWFIIKTITKIPKALLDIINKIEQIPSDIVNKIKGNIKLYITVDDLEMLYNNSLLRRLDDYIEVITALTKGEMWGTFFNKIQRRNDTGKPFSFRINQNDMKLCRKAEALYNTIENIKFSQSVIEMNNQEVIQTYFGNDKRVISFIDLKGKQHQGTYYETLIQLMKDIESRKSSLELIQTDFGKKYDDNQRAQEFAKLGVMAQNRVVTTMQQISKVLSIIGNIIKYVTTDINTMDTTIKKLLKSK